MSKYLKLTLVKMNFSVVAYPRSAIPKKMLRIHSASKHAKKAAYKQKARPVINNHTRSKTSLTVTLNEEFSLEDNPNYGHKRCYVIDQLLNHDKTWGK